MKIVINTCFGGWGLSHAAYLRYAELKGIELYAYKENYRTEELEEVNNFKDNTFIQYATKQVSNKKELNENYFYLSRDESRTDPLVIQVVEELGKKASSCLAKLKIIEIPDGTEWELDDYDGVESIHETHRVWD